VVDIDSCGRGRLFRSFGVLLLQFLLNTKNWITWQGDKEWKLCFVTGQFFRRAMLHSPRQKRPFFEHCLCPLLTAPIDSFVHGIGFPASGSNWTWTACSRQKERVGCFLLSLDKRGRSAANNNKLNVVSDSSVLVLARPSFVLII
jgi:hypothetical protein